MSFLDSITTPVASAAGAVLNYLGTQSTNQSNVDLANANNAWSAEQYATRYQTQVKDLEAAGLNPALAYGQSPGSAPQAQTVVLQNPYSSATEAYTGIKSTHGKYEHDIASAGAADKMQRQIDATTDKIREEIKNVSDQGMVLRQTAQMLSQHSTLMAQQGESQQKQREVMEATIQNLKKDGLLKELDIDAARALDNLGRTSAQLKPVVDILRVLLRK